MTEREGQRIRAVVVDDEPLSRALILEYLAGHPDIEVVAECANGFEAVRAVTELQPDLIFLDVQMPKLDGFEVLELIGSDAGVIFVTAYDTYALRAFEVHAVDYLLSPSARRVSPRRSKRPGGGWPAPSGRRSRRWSRARGRPARVSSAS